MSGCMAVQIRIIIRIYCEYMYNQVHFRNYHIEHIATYFVLDVGFNLDMSTQKLTYFRSRHILQDNFIYIKWHSSSDFV